ncbi:hypothetical protein CsatA_024798 [Cannabis sativa]
MRMSLFPIPRAEEQDSETKKGENRLKSRREFGEDGSDRLKGVVNFRDFESTEKRVGIPSTQLKQTTMEEKSYSQKDHIIWEREENFKEQNLSEWSSPLKLLSQDKEALLKVSVLFASFDQTSRLASGYGACSVIAILIAHWLHCNPKLIPTRVQFESLILQGSSEWRALSNESSYYQNKFSNNHFDIETVINAGIRPVSICTDSVIYGTDQQILCTGKDCCKEYMRKFLSSNIVMKLEKEYKRGYIQLPYLYEKLQVDMSYMCLNAPSPLSSSSTSSYDAPSFLQL